MPTVTLNRKEFERIVGKKLSLENLKDRISMLGTDLDNVNDKEINVEIFPNRPDMLSEQGFARAFSSFIGVKKGLREYKIKKSGYKVIVDKSVTMRPYTACAIVKGVKFTDEKIREIMQIQEKLAATHGRNRRKSAYGLYPSKNIKFPVYYIAKDPNEIKFKPLGFDKEMIASKVEQVHPKGREYKSMTEGWIKYPFFIDAENNVMCMLPYTNSEDTGKVDEKTKEVFVECTGVDFENVKTALNIFVTMLADMGGEIYSIDIVYGNKKITTPNLTPEKMKLDLKDVNKMLGLKLKENDIKHYLEKMGFGYKDKTVLVPAYRSDIMHPVDLMEDIAIAYGYENFKEEIPNVATIGVEDDFSKFKNKIADILVGFGLLEVSNYNLTNEKVQNEKMSLKGENIEVSNAVNVDYNALRKWIIPSLLEILERNKHHDYPQNIFEIGTCFSSKEEDCLSVVLCGNKIDFTSIKQILDYLINTLDLKYEIKEEKHDSFIDGRTGKIIIGKEVGVIGEIHPKVLENFGLDMPAVAFEINLSDVFNIMK